MPLRLCLDAIATGQDGGGGPIWLNGESSGRQNKVETKGFPTVENSILVKVDHLTVLGVVK